jgi:GT2 family glycosyltransferase
MNLSSLYRRIENASVKSSMLNEFAAESLETDRRFQVCVIIPTKNRPEDLVRAVQSVLSQTISPLSIVIVDQSLDFESERRVKHDLAEKVRSCGKPWKLTYVLDPGISGAAMARNRAMQLADGDIWLFLDDDVILEANFVEQILKAYKLHGNAVGVSGVITNYASPPLLLWLWTRTFMRGPFHDERQPIYWNSERLRTSPPLPVHRFGGGLMSFRAEVVREMRFDENLKGVSDGEDVDFCARLGHERLLLIAPTARLVHNHSPSERLRDHWLRRSARGNFFFYQKNWNVGFKNKLCYAWLWTGYILVASFASLRRYSLDPWRALRTGSLEAKVSCSRHRSRERT